MWHSVYTWLLIVLAGASGLVVLWRRINSRRSDIGRPNVQPTVQVQSSNNVIGSSGCDLAPQSIQCNSVALSATEVTSLDFSIDAPVRSIESSPYPSEGARLNLVCDVNPRAPEEESRPEFNGCEDSTPPNERCMARSVQMPVMNSDNSDIRMLSDTGRTSNRWSQGCETEANGATAILTAGCHFEKSAVGDDSPAFSWEIDSEQGEDGEVQGPMKMRITKRSSGGRGEYEMSESFGQITPRDVIGCCIVFDLGNGLRINTGVRLLDRNGKRRLRIDATSGAEIHVHRQLAALLLMPYPARAETAWGRGSPVMETGHYGIENINLSHVEISEGRAIVAPEGLEISNCDEQVIIDCVNRMKTVKELWARCDDMSPIVGELFARHAASASRGTPIGPELEEIVTAIQKAAVSEACTRGMLGDERHDVLALIGDLFPERASVDINCDMAGPDSVSSTCSERLGDVETPTLAETSTVLRKDVTPAEPDVSCLNTVIAHEASHLDKAECDESKACPVASENDAPGELNPIPRTRRFQPQSRISRPRPRRSNRSIDDKIERACGVEVRLRFRTGGMISVSLLPRRREGFPDEIEALGLGEEPIFLTSLHETWFQDVIPKNLGAILRNGVAWRAEFEGTKANWLLSGRDLYVLGPRDEIGGFVSTPRLTLGEKHVVLCATEIHSEVADILRECCTSEPVRINSNDGLPGDWTGFRDVVPVIPLAVGESPDIFDALRPAPDLQISLRGGIRLQYSQWLSGFPPMIKLFGDYSNCTMPLTIDGIPAVQGEDDSFTCDGWDLPGEHVVVCEGQTRSYGLTIPEENWELWPAHGAGDACICGTIVGRIGGQTIRHAVVVPATNCLLLGKNPGEIYTCAQPHGVRNGQAVGAPPFHPVWAVPSSPLRVNKKAVRVIHLDFSGPVTSQFVPSKHLLRQWCDAVLNCNRKRLQLDTASPEHIADWKRCRDSARAIWRRPR